MKRFLFILLAALCLLAAPARAGLPVAEADYLKNEEARFDSADKNHDGLLQKEEMPAAFLGGELQPTPATRDACARAGKGIRTNFTPPPPGPDGQEPRPLPKQDFVSARRGMFEHADANHDKTVTTEEAAGMDRQMAKMCAAAPAMMDQARNFQNMGMNGQPSPEQLRQMMERARAMQQQMPGGPPPQGLGQ